MGTNQNNLTSPEYPHCNCVTQTSQTGKKKNGDRVEEWQQISTGDTAVTSQL